MIHTHHERRKTEGRIAEKKKRREEKRWKEGGVCF